MKKLIYVFVLGVITTVTLQAQITNPPYVTYDFNLDNKEIIKEGFNEHHDSIVFSEQGRALWIQPGAELHIYDKIVVDGVNNGVIVYGYCDDDAEPKPKLVFHNCNNYIQGGDVNVDTRIEIEFDCETLTYPEASWEDKSLYPYDCIIYNMLGQVLYKGKFGNVFYYDRMADPFTNKLIFIKIMHEKGYFYLRRYYKYGR